MKSILLLMATLLAATSCAKQDSLTSGVLDNTEAPEFSAEIVDTTRIYIAEDGDDFKLSWHNGDLLSVFFNEGGNSQYKFADATGATSGKIVAVNAKQGKELTNYYAVYPYGESNSLSGEVLSISLPAEQQYAVQSFSKNINTMVATSDDKNNFEFKNVCGYIRLKVYGNTTVKSIKLEGNNGEVLAGAATVDMTTGKLTLSGNDTSITLNCGEGVKLGTMATSATTFWFVVPPTVFEEGFTFTLTDADGKTTEQVRNEEFSIERNTVYDGVIALDKPLSLAEAESIMQTVESEWLETAKSKYAAADENNVFTYNGLQLKIWAIFINHKPADGRSLYISMHGGGGISTSANDDQWRNQQYLYRPEEGVYVAPRAPWDEWNMWFKAGLDELFEQLIQAAVARWDVNPDKVYLMGYSAGGDGVYKMGPRMADRWAAASMMAGHPNGVSMVNLRNTPFSIWVGANDSSFNRNTVAAEYGKILDDLQAADPEGYIHETHIVADKGHWMDNEDRAAVPWMAQYKRNPYPKKIVWRQAEVMRTSFYWLAIQANEYKNEATVIAEIKDNSIHFSKCDYKKLRIYLNDKMLDLDKPVKIYLRNELIFNDIVPRTAYAIKTSMDERGDIRYMFPAFLDLTMATDNSLENPSDGDDIIWS